MKNFYLVISALLLFLACSPKENKESELPENPMIGTIWEAPDEVSTLIWGTTISRLEFLDSNNFQDISITKGSVRKIERGTYVHNTGNVFLLYPKYFSDGRDWNISCKVSGSIMTTDRPNLYGGNMTYQKK